MSEVIKKFLESVRETLGEKNECTVCGDPCKPKYPMCYNCYQQAGIVGLAALGNDELYDFIMEDGDFE